MEPKQFDEMARRAVLEKESNASLDSKQADLLWANIGEEDSNYHVGWWRAAAVILFLLSSSLIWYGTELRHSQKVLEVQLLDKEARLTALELLKDKESTRTIVEKAIKGVAETETIFVRDTVVKTIVEQKIVYVDREVFTYPEFDADSLIAIIQNQQVELDQMARYVQADESAEYLSNFNVVFEDPDVTGETGFASQKQASFKFNLSLFKRNLR